jgi:osmoprotectant transport system permease protein
MSIFFGSLHFMATNLGLLFAKTAEHMQLSVAAIALALVIAAPIGLWLGHFHRGSLIAVSISNLGRALPSLALVAIGLGVLGIGFANVLVVLTILAIPPILTNAYLSIEQIDPDVVRAARGMGLRRWQILTRIELPIALPLLFAGIRTAVVYVISSATLAAIAGGGGLGDLIFNEANYGLDGVIAAALWVAALALLAEGVFMWIQRILTPHGLRLERSPASS